MRKWIITFNKDGSTSIYEVEVEKLAKIYNLAGLKEDEWMGKVISPSKFANHVYFSWYFQESDGHAIGAVAGLILYDLIRQRRKNKEIELELLPEEERNDIIQEALRKLNITSFHLS